MEFKNSRTFKNLIKSYVDESLASTLYGFYAIVAEKDGFVQISNIFKHIGENEEEHAKRLYKVVLEKGRHDVSKVETKSIVDLLLSKTLQNLETSVSLEEEAQQDYREYAKVAREEGFHDIENLFQALEKSEHSHAQIFTKLAFNVKNNQVFNKEIERQWQCINCGYAYKGKHANEVCPLCHYPKSFAQLREDNF